MNRGAHEPVTSDMLSISPKAREMLDQFAAQADESSEVLLRVEIVGSVRCV